MPINYVPDDGYAEPFYIEAAPRLYRELRGLRRPVHGRELARLRDAIRGKSEEAADEAACKLVAAHLTSWDHVDRHGAPVPVTAKAVLDLHPLLRWRLLQVVQGYEATDIDPQWTAEQKAEIEGLVSQAAAADRPIGDVQAEANLKN